jgi:ParB-like chromosome segregation protein Spo0J
MPPDQMRALVGSIERFGIVDPIIVNQKNLVIGGHQRVEAGKSLGLKEVPVIRVKVSEREMKTLNLALNRISGEWDETKLAPILTELEKFPEINLTGFSQVEISKLITQEQIDTTIKEYDENLVTEHECPKCGYKW